jgi:Ca2+-transporting ATPase
VQLLWVNLVTDGPPATALGFNPPDLDIMKKPPRRRDEQLITTWVFIRYMIVGCYVGVATVAAFAIWYMYDSFWGLDLSADGHSTVTWHQLTHWQDCPSWQGFTASNYTAGALPGLRLRCRAGPAGAPPAPHGSAPPPPNPTRPPHPLGAPAPPPGAGAHTVSFSDPCDFFTVGKAKASTLSLTVIVAIEMFNALNALSEDGSLVTMPPWANPWLLVAMVLSIGLHCVILYIPVLADIFSIVPLSLNEWLLVVGLSFPVILIDEVLKFLGRHMFGVQHVKVKKD